MYCAFSFSSYLHHFFNCELYTGEGTFYVFLLDIFSSSFEHNAWKPSNICFCYALNYLKCCVSRLHPWVVSLKISLEESVERIRTVYFGQVLVNYGLRYTPMLLYFLCKVGKKKKKLVEKRKAIL